MTRQVLFAVAAAIALMACEKPCKQGYQRYGVKCVPSLVKDASVDPIRDDDGGSDQESPGSSVDAGAGSPAEPVLDAGPMDASEPIVPDAEVVGPLCYVDADGDGIGAGAPRPCSDAGDAGVGTIVSTSGDCDDGDAQRSPSLTDVCGDKIDNDCDGMVDEEANNACGGACSAQLGHQPGEVCSNGLLGACARSGEYSCSGTSGVVCNAPMINPSTELCRDSIDNDCDGQVNEADAADTFTWYRDCDSDTVAASVLGSLKSCAKPAATDTCANWTDRTPAGKTSIDCNDASPIYSPLMSYYFPPAGRSDHDLNCDGVVERETDRIVARFAQLGADVTHVYPVCKSPSECDCATWTAMPSTCSKNNQDMFYNVMQFYTTSQEGACLLGDGWGALVLCR